MEEIWKDVTGYEGHYQVSNKSRIKSLSRPIKTKWGNSYICKEKILNPVISNGYQHVTLSKEGKSKLVKVHRIIALAFLDGYFEGAIINHINSNRSDNRLENLEWCTNKHNTHHAIKQGKMRWVSGLEHANSRPIINILTGKIYTSQLQFSKAFDCSIGAIIRNIGKSAGVRSRTRHIEFHNYRYL